MRGVVSGCGYKYMNVPRLYIWLETFVVIGTALEFLCITK